MPSEDGLPSKLNMSFHHIEYKKNIPEEVAGSLVSLYQSAFCVREYFDLYHERKQPSAVAIYSDGGSPVHVVFYSISGGEATVFNELFDIDEDCVKYFAEFIFNTYPKVHTIHLNKFKLKLERFPLPFKIWDWSQDIVVELPETMAEYRSMLGKRTKANMSNYSNKLRREYSDFSFDVVTGRDIEPATISEIIEMNRTRMKSKKTTSAIDADLEKRIIEFSREYGIVGTVRLDGRIAAGTICYVVGNHCYADVIAHDSAYNQYSIGQVCIYLMIQSLIQRGLSAFHMAWGENEYKYRLLGVDQKIYFASIFRSELSRKMGLIRHAGKYRYVTMLSNLIKYRYLGRLRDAFSPESVQ